MFEAIKRFFMERVFFEEAPKPDLTSMTKAELRDYAEGCGIKLPQRINKDRMIHIIKKEV